MTDVELANAIAREAGELLCSIRSEGKQQGKELGRRGDQEANTLILDRLKEARPDDFVLSEEAKDDLSRCAAKRVWIVDPLDGTREYSEGREDWAVHIGLAIDGVPVIGAVALPALDLVLDTSLSAPLSDGAGSPRIVVSRTRPPREAEAVAEALRGTMVPMGSAGAKAMAVVRGEADIYIHSGGQYEWDSCAPVAVAKAAGLHASRIDGAPLIYNCEDVSLPDLLICRPEHAEAVLAVTRSAD
ncbi:3'(2'),5'-bisphosphate nucleotidase CysQ [Stakelama marina]|uniref:3'(2'),5-bisphosphonucleoside 3'(2')-phosphohydrolase n=1 Tax=Stakelama marina TaxID=2826939 RepID=A0A8T4IJ86_9SPHN|nr:3'(2'),5'-bisphosphate nucleotidase CysQ [Stakelama marina]MBR0553944.1 3'(2'),5'-bisphosphate nucleotidase CysQ [Stakelama marina]